MMATYINVDLYIEYLSELRDSMKKYGQIEGMVDLNCEIVRAKNFPAADVKEVVRGYWINTIESLAAENAALKARLDKAVDVEQKEEIEWDKSESKVMKSRSEPMHYVYTHKITGEKYRLGDLQDKYGLGFADSKLWKIIERDYEGEIRPQREWTSPKL